MPLTPVATSRAHACPSPDAKSKGLSQKRGNHFLFPNKAEENEPCVPEKTELVIVKATLSLVIQCTPMVILSRREAEAKDP